MSYADGMTEQEVNTAKWWEAMFTEAGVVTQDSTKAMMRKLIQMAKNYPVEPAPGNDPDALQSGDTVQITKV